MKAFASFILGALVIILITPLTYRWRPGGRIRRDDPRFTVANIARRPAIAAWSGELPRVVLVQRDIKHDVPGTPDDWDVNEFVMSHARKVYASVQSGEKSAKELYASVYGRLSNVQL